MPTPAFRTEVPPHTLDLILGRPTTTAVTLSVLAYEDLEGRVVWEAASGGARGDTGWQRLPQGSPVEIVLRGLRPAVRHRYELRYRKPGAVDEASAGSHSFSTAALRGTSFAFAVQADSHLDYGTDPDLYRATLGAILASGSDFLIDLGDTFMTDKYLRFTDAAPHYLAQRYYLGLVGHSVPVYLVLGNHDGERPGPRRGTEAPDAMALWSNALRKRYFPNPVPDGFYGGNGTPHPEAGLLQNYYSWEWGDALFVVLDPFWYSGRQRSRPGEPLDQWGWTLGREQYQWLSRTLETSQAALKFVFTHQLVGGATREGRGGAEAAALFEWGGREVDGRNTFRDRRPGWPAPIHDLLVKHGVAVVFHGHDHMYAHAEREGVVYQLVPQPGHPRPSVRSAAEYGYGKETVLPGSGYLRIQVSPDSARVEYRQLGRDRGMTAAQSYRVGPRMGGVRRD